MIIEAVRTLPLSGDFGQISQKQNHDLLFEQYDIDKLQGAVCIYFYYNEFMDNLKTLFMETNSQATLNITEPCSLKLIFTSISNLVTRLRPNTQP
jgi:hypothetical protein